MWEIFSYCLLFGCLAGLLAGLFGIGGGVVLVPFFLWLLPAMGVVDQKLMVIAIATSLATIILTSIAAVAAQQRLKAIKWDVVYRLAPGILIGAMLGAVVADFMPRKHLQLVFAVYLIYVGFQMALQFKSEVKPSAKGNLFYVIAGFLIGLVAAVLGVGGGTLTVPVLVGGGMLMANAVAVSSACGLPIAIAGTLSYGYLGWQQTNMADGFLGYVYLPAFAGIIVTSLITAPLGAKLVHRLPTRLMKRFFSILVFTVAAKLIQSL